MTEFDLVPRVVRLDRCTANVHIENTETLMHADHADGLAPSAVMFGSSTHNPRIERFWSYLRRLLLNDYIPLFKGYLDLAIIDSSNHFHMECLAFGFIPALRVELEAITNL